MVNAIHWPLSMSRTVKLMLLHCGRILGLFVLARWLTRRRLRILCYHGFSLLDEHLFEPILFMRREVFAARLSLLDKLAYPVVTLDDGLELLRTDSVSNSQVVITIDDGWKSTRTVAAPILKDYGYPATLYVTTFYAKTQTAVFNVVVWYLLWRTKLPLVTLRGFSSSLDGTYDISGDRFQVGQRWITLCEREFRYSERDDLLVRLCTALELDPQELFFAERFKLLAPAEIALLAEEYGLEPELHTHRHRLPTESQKALGLEIGENRDLLMRWTGKPASHFCYPSGKYTPIQTGWLAKVGVLSATTCDEGLNSSPTNPMLLRRYLDRDTWDPIEFEAAVSGFTEVFVAPLSRLLGH